MFISRQKARQNGIITLEYSACDIFAAYAFAGESIINWKILSIVLKKVIFMGRRRDRLNRRRENQIKTRKANTPRKAKERARKAAQAASAAN